MGFGTQQTFFDPEGFLVKQFHHQPSRQVKNKVVGLSSFIHKFKGYSLSIIMRLETIVARIITFLKYLYTRIRPNSIYNYRLIDLKRSPRNNPIGFKNPRDLRMNYEDVEIKTSDGVTLRGWFMEYSRVAPTMIYLHEQQGNIGARLFFIHYCQKYLGSNVLVVSFRGYGDSEGVASQQGFVEDVKAMINYAHQRNDIDKTRVYVHGRGLGASAAAYALFDDKKIQNLVDKVILDNIIQCAEDIVKPCRRSQRHQWDTLSAINIVNTDALFLISAECELTSMEKQLEIYNKVSKANNKTTSKYISEASSFNNNWCTRPKEYFGQIKKFLS